MPKTEFLTGQAGTGKTYEIRRRIEEDPSYALLCATTGVAATNLNTVTINSAIGYYDTDSLMERYRNGSLLGRLRSLSMGDDPVKNLVVDEVSMMDADQLDILYDAFCELEAQTENISLGLILTGDFAQLPPVKAKFAFQAKCWPVFEESTTKLEKVWRQSNREFLDALNWIRKGNGYKAVKILRDLNIDCGDKVDDDFDGLTIKSTNREVEPVNARRYAAIPGPEICVRNTRVGEQRTEWKLIPEELQLKEGALVMVLANGPRVGDMFSYVNGDLGHIVGFDLRAETFKVELKREGGGIVDVCKVKRPNKVKGHDGRARQIGFIEYMPLRLAYAATAHKTQGLTLDRVQVDVRGKFFENPGMVYVALSRCRTPEGLRIVGSRELLAKRTVIDPRIAKWL
jgi:ATP-dependent exoDNAse (exonuclease V) alpha subunit